VKYSLVILRYGEIALKSKYVRKKFENILIKNIKFALNNEKIENKIEKERGRIYIYTSKVEPTCNVLKRIIGIVNFSPAVKTDSKIESLSKTSIDFSKKYLKKDISFALRVTRTGNQPYNSQFIKEKIGNDIVNKYGSKVDLTNPDFKLYIEIRSDSSYIFNKKILGVGGMPVGSQDKVLCIIKDKFSILASWYLLKRGCGLVFLVKKDFDLKLLKSFLKKWYIKDDIIFFNESKDFYKKINDLTSKKDCKAIITDFYNLNEENIQEIKQYKKEIKVPTLHPLIFMNENELNEKIKEIGL